MENGKAYTLIELLVAISVMAIIFGVGFAAYREFARRQALTQAASDLRENLRLAQQKALAGEKPAGCTGTLNGYLVHFATSSVYEIRADCGSLGFQASDPLTKSVSLVGVTKSAGPSDFGLFKVLGQGTNQSSDLTITLKQNVGSATTPVTVTKNGEIK